MINKAIITALALSLGAAAAQAGEGSVDSRNNVVGTQQYPRDYAYPYAAAPGPVYSEPGYVASEPMIEEDGNTGYAPRSWSDEQSDYNDQPGNE